jgi:2,3-bisphosphoglycerate-independent phosphoglycerate mutase
MTSSPVVLVIMDGWGVTAPSVGNAVTSANLKYWSYLLANYPSSLLQASGAAVGLPWGVMGNSEVGHFTIGAGRIYLQSLEYINQQISKGDFFENQAFLKVINHVKNNSSDLHLIGLLGEGGVHAHQGHLLALLELAQKNSLNNNTYIHLFLDGRDSARDSGMEFLGELKSDINKLGCGAIASVGGRFYGMDRNKNWDRIKKAYDSMIGKSEKTCTDATKYITESYKKKVYDEEMEPTMILKDGKPVGSIKDNDGVIFFNFRSDRARQLTRSFVDTEFKEFEGSKKFVNLMFATFSEYEKGLATEVAFPKPEIDHPLARIISDNDRSQLHVAETEKYAHVTFFINGLKEEPYKNEKRILLSSPMVASYAEKPEMAAYEIRNKVVASLEGNQADFTVINFANADMVGHTGNLEATKKAIDTVSECLESVVETTLKMNGKLIITADHGNSEEMINLETRALDKEHSNNPVPVVIVDGSYKGKVAPRTNDTLHNAQIQGALVDIAPTVLSMMGLDKHEQMIGIDLTKVII